MEMLENVENWIKCRWKELSKVREALEILGKAQKITKEVSFKGWKRNF